MPTNGHHKSPEQLEAELNEAQRELDQARHKRSRLLRIQFRIIVVIAALAGVALLVMLWAK